MKNLSGAGALALAVLLGACSSGEDGTTSDATETAAEVEETTTTAPDTTTTETPDTAAADEVEAETPTEVASRVEFLGAEFVTDGEPLIRQFSPVPVGDYWIPTLGTEISFSTSQDLFVQPNGIGFGVLTDINSAGPDDRDIVFIRVSAFSDPTQPNLPREEQEFWPNDNIAGWLDNLDEGVVISDPVATSIGGLDATFFELELGEIECGYAPGTCVGFALNNGVNEKPLTPGSQYRIWVVDQQDEDPLAIIVGIQDPADVAWFEQAEDALSTLAFGEVQAAPLYQTTTEPTEIPALGGIEVTFPDERTIGEGWAGRGYLVAVFNEFQSQIDIVDQPRRPDGEVIATADEVVSVLEESVLELTEVEPATVSGVDARVFDYTSADAQAVILTTSELDVLELGVGWQAGVAGRLWVIDHPERGPQFVSAKAFNAPEDTLPAAQTWIEELIASLTYVDLG